MRKIYLLIGASALVAACKTTKDTVQTPLPAPETELRQLDTMEITAEAEPTGPEDYTLPVYRAEEPRPNDLLHTKLRVRFDWEKEQVLGQATLTLKPTFYPQDSVTLDAKHFQFNTVALGEEEKTPLGYRVNADSTTVTIGLPRTYENGEAYELYLDYVATPEAAGGSSAITSDKGLFFIKPDSLQPDKPHQIWTQGETEHNSNWMPTLDQPNERATQEFYIMVADKYQTLSNGLLIGSEAGEDSTRTDYWRMDLPHAPYLHMLAVGEFAKVDDTWRDIPLSYYVEQEYEPYAKEIFAHTPEMLEFFSNLLGYDYPWSKYAQIIVRDYVSGAMENTGAVIFGDFVQKDDRELADDNNDLIVAHEMFHHWFGDLVTTESWSNLTLNEGFANYSEYLWLEHHDGLDAAEDHRMTELEGYLGSGQAGGFHPLIWYQFDSPEDMFDGHSYNKGGLVLHMLRNLVGDEAFFASLKRYLSDNAFTAVEVDELRLAFEDETGLDLNWFFDQWFLGNGQPELNVSYGYADGNAQVTVEQTQDPDEFRPIFRLPTQIGVYPADGSAPSMTEVEITERKQTFTVPAAADDLIVFDPKSVVLSVRNEERTSAEQAAIFDQVPDLQQRLNAVRSLREASETGDYTVDAALVERALVDSSARVRNNGIALLDLDKAEDVAKLAKLAREDKVSNVRMTALNRLSEADSVDVGDLYKEIIANEQSYGVLAASLPAYYKADSTAALAEAEKLEEVESDEVMAGIATIYAQNGNEKYNAFFERSLGKVDGQAAGQLAAAYLGSALKQGPENLTAAVETLGTMARDQSTSLWRRYGFTSALAELRGAVSSPQAPTGMDAVASVITEQIDAAKAAETNSQLKAAFSSM